MKLIYKIHSISSCRHVLNELVNIQIILDTNTTISTNLEYKLNFIKYNTHTCYDGSLTVLVRNTSGGKITGTILRVYQSNHLSPVSNEN